MSDDIHKIKNTIKVLTYHQFKDEIAMRWERAGYEFDQYDLESTATSKLWHDQNLLPFVECGGQFPLVVCKSIVKHGWESLDWYAKNYPSCLGKYTNVRTGYAISKRDLKAWKEARGES